MKKLTKKERFQEKVLSRYHVYNSVFSTLPYDSISQTGQLLPILTRLCEEGFKKKSEPKDIIENFFSKYCEEYNNKQKVSLLFRFIQYIERQVVLFDAIEDASFKDINNLDGVGTLRNLKEEFETNYSKEDLTDYLSSVYVRPVLTAHPTQFYPGSVLGIITELSKSIQENDLKNIKDLLSQLGKTPFFKSKKPTPYDEAVSLCWYLENVFYNSIAEIFKYVKSNIFENNFKNFNLISLGFWPGGDRDGNPFVTTKITLKTAFKLRSDILKNYYRDVRKLRRRLTFKNIESEISEIEDRLYKSMNQDTINVDLKLNDLKLKLKRIRKILIDEHQSLFLEQLDDFILKVEIFGYHFATLDIRQDSRIHSYVFSKIIKKIKCKDFSEYVDSDYLKKSQILSLIINEYKPSFFDDKLVSSTLESIRAMKKIQKSNGESGCHRYIISNNQTAINILEVFTMFKISGWEKNTFDIVPLFETISDLEISPEIMEKIYSNHIYRKHLSFRNNEQTIMLGFSDGTKDGGYLTANWKILNAKERLTKVARKHKVKVKFFDGRGGPPARGGGNTHQFYSSQGSLVESDDIQITIQGQTISSNFGTIDSCKYNLEQLVSSAVKNKKNKQIETFSKENRKVLEQLSNDSYKSYKKFKNHPNFLGYLENMTTIKYYSKTNIGSRPSRRNGDNTKFNFDNLRAIPFVGSWAQLKQNVPGFYGLGTALNEFYKKNDFKSVKKLFKEVPFFRALVSNSMMSLNKSFFDLTAYMSKNEIYGEFWNIIFDEYLLTKKMVLKLTGYRNLMENEPANKASVDVREKIILPLVTIQQYALQKINLLKKNNTKNVDQIDKYEKIVTRSLFGNINASRNSA
tara:strand:- start:546 stop:3119 length:2574 start_codon:yes stop_codon:yes gene_type:complete